MRHIFIYCVAALLAISASTHAQERLSADSIRLVRGGADEVLVEMHLDLTALQVSSDEVILVVPTIEALGQSPVELRSVGIYGRRPYYYLRRAGRWLLQGPDDILFRAKDAPPTLHYTAAAHYEEWMDSAQVGIYVSTNGYCDGIIAESRSIVMHAQPIIEHRVEHRDPIIHEVSGRAYVDFIVNRTELRPDYHDNTRELLKIKESIDSLRADTANHIRGITIKGWASPEGPYWNNVRLARGRSRTLRQHIIDHYDVEADIIESTYEPEDWPGLRLYVEQSSLPHREEILAIIDTDEEPDARLDRIRRTYPQDFAHLAQHSLPYLRHSDYTIAYERTDEMGLHREYNDTLWQLPAGYVELTPPVSLPAYRPIVALKSNLLFDLAATPNFEIEVPFGRNREWSLMAEDWFPWYVWHQNSRAYELWNVGLELRRWFWRCYGSQPVLSGHFAGLYASTGKYDVEIHHQGDQGEFFSVGATYGYSYPLSAHWNLEFSASAGAVWGPRRHYHGEFGDTHLIWKHFGNIFYAGPTKLKLSLVWLLGPDKKGGDR